MPTPTYKDSSKPIEERVADLISRMTIQEKIGQMTNLRGYLQYERTGEHITISESFQKQYSDIPVGSLGAFCRADWYTGKNWGNGLPPHLAPRAVNMFQKYAIEHSRLGIPLWITEPTVHGLMVLGGTVFPSVTALGSTWNRELVEQVYSVAAREGDALRIHRGCLSLDIARDPRWSRVEECFGEDPYLVAQLGVASTYGLQGRDFPQKGKIVAVMRHFAAHGDPEGGHNQAPAHIGKAELHNIHLKPFRECTRAGARGVMSSYNLVDGISCSGSKELLTGLLRNTWGFKGYVVPDAGAICKLKWDRFAADDAEACALAIKSGVDMDLWNPEMFVPGVKDALARGLLAESDIDQAVTHFLTAKFEMGLFENPYADEATPTAILSSPEHREVALKAARESLVLLANRKQTLPVRGVTSIAVIGPNADSPANQLGDYTAPQKDGDVVTVLAGMKEVASKYDVTIRHERGCKIRSLDSASIPAAVSLAKGSDCVVLVLGGSSAPDKEVDFLPTGAARINEIRNNSEVDKESGEGYDRASLDLKGRQMELFRKLKETGKRIIVVLVMGRPLIINEILDQADAVLLAWYPGMMGGRAVAEAVFGEYNPGGKLPISFPRDIGQLPVYYNSHQPRVNYIDMEGTPKLSFGYGLSYTTFAYSSLELSQKIIRTNESVEVSVSVCNTGAYDGDEVVQLYITDLVSSTGRPHRELRGFQRVFLRSGEKQVIVFRLGPDELGCYDSRATYSVEPGDYTIAAGGGLDSLLESILSVTR